jgi:transposase
VVEAHCSVEELECPDCSTVSRRVHSRYERHLTELPVGGRRVVVRLMVRRFFCDDPGCSRRTFVEQVEGLTTRYARAGPGVKVWWRAVALTLGGRPGMRMCRVLAVPSGRERLLGLLNAPPVPDRSPRVLGVDDFAFRRSRTYGTIVLDVESSTVIDVLPDRTSQTLAAWLAMHPGAEIVCRDRAGTYSKAIRQAAPQAREVADRFHLVQNLTKVLERICREHIPCLRKHAELDARLTTPPERTPLFDYPGTALLERTRRRFEDIQRLHGEGRTINAIARYLNLDSRTVHRYVKTPLDELLASADNRRPNGRLEPFKAYLNERHAQLGADAVASRLFREVRERGYRGSQRSVQRHLARLSAGTVEPVRITVPAPRTIAVWIARPREHLSANDQEALLKVRLACPDIARACDLAWAFLEMARHQRGTLLPDWIRQAEQDAPKPLRAFAAYLRQDLDAVTAGLTLNYSSGVLEGHVNRLRRSSGRCTAADPFNSFVPASSCDRDRPEIPPRAARARRSGRSSCARCVSAACPGSVWSSPTSTPGSLPRSAR